MKLTKEHLKIVDNHVINFCNTYRIKDGEELKSHLYLKLVYILAKYDPNRGVDFKHYALNCLRGYSFNFLRDRCRTIKVPRRFSDLNSKYRSYIRNNVNGNKKDFCEKNKITINQLEEALEAANTTFYELTDYNLFASNGDSNYNQFCMNYLNSIPKKDLTILESIFVDGLNPCKVYFNYGLSPYKGNELVQKHLKELKTLKSQ